MAVKVQADFVSFRGDAPQEIGPRSGLFGEHEERGPNASPSQEVEKPRRHVGVRPIVEGQRDLIARLLCAMD